MYKKTKLKIRKKMLDAYLRGINKAMQEAKCFWNVEVKQHGTQEDCVWVIIG